MDDNDRQTSWTTVVRRGKAQAKVAEKASAKPPQKASTTAGRRRPPTQPKCGTTPKSKAGRQQPKQQPKPPPTVFANAPSSEQWDTLWPSLSTAPPAPLRRGAKIAAPAHNPKQEHQGQLNVPERGVFEFTDAGESLPTEASDGENAAPKQQKPKPKTCTFRWGMKRPQGEQHKEPPAASEGTVEQCQPQRQLRSQQQPQRKPVQQLKPLRPLQQWLRLQLVQPLDDESLNFLSVSITPASCWSGKLEDSNLLGMLHYTPEGTNVGELIHAMQFVLGILEKRRHQEDFMENIQSLDLSDPSPTASAEGVGEYTHLSAFPEAPIPPVETAAYNRKRPYLGEPTERDFPTKTAKDISLCRAEMQRYRAESAERANYLVNLLRAFRLLMARAEKFTRGVVYHRIKVVEYLLAAAVAETGGNEPAPANLHDLPPQQLQQLRQLMELQGLPVSYYFKKAAKFSCRRSINFRDMPQKPYTQDTSCATKPTDEKETQWILQEEENHERLPLNLQTWQTSDLLPSQMLSPGKSNEMPAVLHSDIECASSADSPFQTQWILQEEENHERVPLNLQPWQTPDLLPSQMLSPGKFNEMPAVLHSDMRASTRQECPMQFQWATGETVHTTQQEQHWNACTGNPIPKELEWICDAEVKRRYLNNNTALLQPNCQQQQPPNTPAPGMIFFPIAASEDLHAERTQALFWPFSLNGSSLNRSAVAPAPAEPSGYDLLQQKQQGLTSNPPADDRRDWLECKRIFSLPASSSDNQSADLCQKKEVGDALQAEDQKVLDPCTPSSDVLQDSPQSHPRLTRRRRGKKQQQPQQQQQQPLKQHQHPHQQQRQQQPRPHQPQTRLQNTQVTNILHDSNLYAVYRQVLGRFPPKEK
ncbi:hypothetical protein, conserved [Eimeria praecox]|uniref:Uncharacterized protein n=1 Tax=Eimeria praecox TaxID=51316 RepID=U6G326_9EIME|nr:hypothetical protein, conserved [Eimeria praecox]